MTEPPFDNLPDDHPPFVALVEAGKLHTHGPLVIAMPWTGDASEYLPDTKVVKCRVCDCECCVSPEARALPDYQPVCIACAREHLPMDSTPAVIKQTMDRARELGFSPFIEKFLGDGGTMGDVFAAMDAAEKMGMRTPQNPRPRFHGWGKA